MKLITILLAITMLSCYNRVSNSEATNFNQLDMSFSNGWDIHFSIIINKKGYFVVGVGHPVTHYFKGELNLQDLKKLDSLTSKILEIPDSVFVEDKVDQASFAFMCENTSLRKKYFIYGNKGPIQLIITRKLIFDLVSGINSSKFDTSVTFRSLEGFYRQSPPPKEHE